MIDDDPVCNFINQTPIKSVGVHCQVIIAQNGQQGLDHLLEENDAGRSLPDVILLDINMPVVNGFEFLQELHSLGIMQNVSERIAILSSSHSSADKRRAMALGVTSYFVKPMSADDVRKLFD